MAFRIHSNCAQNYHRCHCDKKVLNINRIENSLSLGQKGLFLSLFKGIHGNCFLLYPQGQKFILTLMLLVAYLANIK